MGKLKVLPAQVANMIAAGEVVQRPASVVKELVENAIDAGADKISVVLTDSGRTLIQVIDNGCGMSAADAQLCFERHATSKIASAEDISNIISYGFRGEALPSIASVSSVILKTRREGDETGTQVDLSDQGAVKASAVACPKGSNFAIRNLFYNTPARRKFLKSDTVELKHCVDEFIHVAIPHPEIEFSLTHNGKTIYDLKKAKSLKFRIQDILGPALAGEVVDIKVETHSVNLVGFVGRPEKARKTLGNQFMFVDGRYFKSPYFHKAIMNAYEDLIPDGVTPTYVLFLSVDPSAIDVNIHPTKTEVKFEDDSIIFQTIYACVKEAVGRNAFGASIEFNTEGSIEMPQLGGSFDEFRAGSMSPDPGFDESYDPFASDPVFGSGDPSFGGSAPSFGGSTPTQATQNYQNFVSKKEDYSALFEQTTAPVARTIVLKDRFILTPSASGLMIVNVKRARERILFEKYLEVLSGTSHVTQTALFPVQCEVGASNRLVFDDNKELLESLGFDIAPFGVDTVVVNGVPESFSCEAGKVDQMVRDLLLILSEGSNALPEMMKSNMASKFATLGALNGSQIVSPAEAQSLLDRLFSCSNSELTPNGRKIVSVLSLDELEKRF